MRVRRDVSGGLDIDVAAHDLRARAPDRELPARSDPPKLARRTPGPPKARRRSRRAKRTKRPLILFLAADPCHGRRLELGEECAAIQRELKLAIGRNGVRFESRWAISIDELMRHLTELDPTVIHLSGHGTGNTGLMLQDEQGRPQPVSARSLAMMVAATVRNTRLVVLNACYSKLQADALRFEVDCVVGMNGAIHDAAARVFAARFYGALGSHRSIGNAFAHAIAALAAMQLPDEVMPRCLAREGIDPDEVVLAPVPRSRRARRRSSASRPRDEWTAPGAP